MGLILIPGEAGGGAGSSDVTATRDQVLTGYTAITSDSDDEPIEGTIATKGAQTITPGTSDKTIAAGLYLTGIQTIKGDANLVAANIIAGQSIFGVAGTAKKDGKTMCVYSVYCAGVKEDPGDNYRSFTMPRAGIVYYSGVSMAVSTSYSGLCRILRNGSVVDNRDINGREWAFRGTMVEKSFTAAAGDFIEIQTTRNGNYNGMCIMTATIFY